MPARSRSSLGELLGRGGCSGGVRWLVHETSSLTVSSSIDDREGADGLIGGQGLGPPGSQVEQRPVPRALHGTGRGVERALGERAVVVRAAVLDRVQLAVAVEDADLDPVGGLDQPHLRRWAARRRRRRRSFCLCFQSRYSYSDGRILAAEGAAACVEAIGCARLAPDHSHRVAVVDRARGPAALQPHDLQAQRGGEQLGADRGRPAAPPRPDPEPGRGGQGLREARAEDLRGRDQGAQHRDRRQGAADPGRRRGHADRRRSAG